MLHLPASSSAMMRSSDGDTAPYDDYGRSGSSVRGDGAAFARDASLLHFTPSDDARDRRCPFLRGCPCGQIVTLDQHLGPRAKQPSPVLYTVILLRPFATLCMHDVPGLLLPPRCVPRSSVACAAVVYQCQSNSPTKNATPYSWALMVCVICRLTSPRTPSSIGSWPTRGCNMVTVPEGPCRRRENPRGRVVLYMQVVVGCCSVCAH